MLVPSVPSSAACDSNFKPLLKDGDVTVCRGRYGAEGAAASVLAVISASDPPARSFLDRVRHEYELKDALEPEWAARPLKRVREEDPAVLLLDDPGGEFLEGLLGQPMDVGLFLRIGAGMARAVAGLHRRGIIHKDIKPAHILVDKRSGAAWLTGFGIASRLRRERQAPEPPEILAGTLAYMAPEQTGRMNRLTDTRSDLYSLGVTFYQMLTGCLPFAASDPMGWVYCHIARKPLPPADAQDRRGTCLRHRHEAPRQDPRGTVSDRGWPGKDLRRCLAAWEAQGRIEEFPLGSARHAGSPIDPGETVRPGTGKPKRCLLPLTTS